MSNQPIEKLWQRAYSITQSQSRPQTIGSHLALPPKFDQELLNDISHLKGAAPDKKLSLIENIRGKFLVAEAMSLVGANDMKEINNILDEI